MGTRSLIFTYDRDGEKIMCLYRQYDGYPEGHGTDLAEILNNTESNGMECLSASIVAKLKTGAYNIYLYPTDVESCGQEYEYHIYKDRVEILDTYGATEEIFTGTYQEFQEFCINQSRKAG